MTSIGMFRNPSLLFEVFPQSPFISKIDTAQVIFVMRSTSFLLLRCKILAIVYMYFLLCK